MISPSTHFHNYANLAYLAVSTGIELFRDGLFVEASYHYMLALQNILKMQEERDEKNDYQQVEIRDCQEMMAQPRHVYLKQLGEPATLSPLAKVSAIGARDSDLVEESWIQCSSMVLLHNSALVHFKTKHYNSARALLSNALELLAAEIDSKPLVSAKFYEDPQNAALAMSLHFLMANVLLQEGRCAPDHDRSISTDEIIVEAAYLECSEAIILAEKYLRVDARNGLLVAQVLSLIGYCMVSDASKDIQDALFFYEIATTLYNGYRGEAETTSALLGEMDKTENRLCLADIATEEVTACAA
jgi:hypothetical protein